MPSKLESNPKYSKHGTKQSDKKKIKQIVHDIRVKENKNIKNID